jgi:hypothetical protein
MILWSKVGVPQVTPNNTERERERETRECTSMPRKVKDGTCHIGRRGGGDINEIYHMFREETKDFASECSHSMSACHCGKGRLQRKSHFMRISNNAI